MALSVEEDAEDAFALVCHRFSGPLRVVQRVTRDADEPRAFVNHRPQHGERFVTTEPPTDRKCRRFPSRWPAFGLGLAGPPWSTDPVATDPSEYEKAMPLVAAHLAKVERAVDRTRASHAGQPYSVVHRALVEALRDEDAQRVVPQAIEEWATDLRASRKPLGRPTATTRRTGPGGDGHLSRVVGLAGVGRCRSCVRQRSQRRRHGLWRGSWVGVIPGIRGRDAFFQLTQAPQENKALTTRPRMTSGAL